MFFPLPDNSLFRAVAEEILLRSPKIRSFRPALKSDFPLPEKPALSGRCRRATCPLPENTLFQAGPEKQLFRSPKNLSINPTRESDFIALSGIRRRATFPLTEKRSYREQRKSDFSAPRKFAI